MNKLLAHCIKEIEYIHDDEVFTVKDLFKGYVWNRLSTGERRNIGYIFKNYIYENKDLNIVHIIKNQTVKESNMQYKKVKKKYIWRVVIFRFIWFSNGQYILITVYDEYYMRTGSGFGLLGIDWGSWESFIKKVKEIILESIT